MENLLTGYAITVVALAAIDGASSIIHSLCELAANSINLKTAQKQIEINKLAAKQEAMESTVRAIGFMAENEEEEEDEEYDY